MCEQKQTTKEASDDTDAVLISIDDIEEFESPPPFIPGNDSDDDCCDGDDYLE